MKTFKRIIIASILIATPVALFSQSYQTNLEKYWYYRNRLITEFMYYSGDPTNIPGSNLVAENRASNTELLPDGDNTYIKWADGTWWLGHYIGVLALEYRLLKDNGQDFSETLTELERALIAFERLDYYLSPPGQLDGYFIRDDVPGDFHQYFDGIDEIHSDGQDPTNGKHHISQDQIWSLFLGLRLAKDLVDESNIQTKVSDLAHQIVEAMHYFYLTTQLPPNMWERWEIVNPQTASPPNSGCYMESVTALCWAYAEAAESISGQNEHYGYSSISKPFFDEAQLVIELLWNGIHFTIDPWNLTNFTIIIEGHPYNVYGISILSLLSNDWAAPEDNIYDWLVRVYYDFAGEYDQPGAFPHLPALAYTLYGYSGSELLEPEFFEYYLNSSPPCGAYHYNTTAGNFVTDIPWHSVSLFSPWHTSGDWQGTGDYNMVDYMLLYTSYFDNYFNDPVPYMFIASVNPNETFDIPRRIDSDCETYENYNNRFTAGEEIHLFPGFHAYPESNFHAYIDPSLGYDVYFSKTFTSPCEAGADISYLNNAGLDDSKPNDLKNSRNNTAESNVHRSSIIDISQEHSHISVYPNPTMNHINILCPDIYERFEIRDYNGKTITQKKISDENISFGFSNCNSGLYLLILFSSDSYHIEKISVVK